MLHRHHHDASDPARGDADNAVATVTDATFEPFTNGRYTVIDFFAPWCGPCRQLAPTFDRAAAQHAGRLGFGRCDVDQNPGTAARLSIMSIPTLILFDPTGREVNRIVGAPGPRQLETFLSAAEPGAA